MRFIFKVAFVERGQEALWRGWVAPNEVANRFDPMGVRRSRRGAWGRRPQDLPWLAWPADDPDPHAYLHARPDHVG